MSIGIEKNKSFVYLYLIMDLHTTASILGQFHIQQFVVLYYSYYSFSIFSSSNNSDTSK